AELHYRRAIQINPNYAGAQVNLGNLLFLKNEFPSAISAYERAERADPTLAAAFYNHSIAASEVYKYDLQAQMLEKARSADRSFGEPLPANPPAQKIVMYSPPISEAWRIRKKVASQPTVRALFGNYAQFDVTKSALNPITIGALASLLLGLALWLL